MDLITCIWIALWGTLPPLAVAWWSYKQGAKGRDIAIVRSDVAMKRLTDLGQELGDRFSEIRVLIAEVRGEIPPPLDTEDLKKSITASVKGTFGQLIKQARHQVDEDTGEIIEDIEAQMTPEEIQGRIGRKILSGLMDRVGGFFG